jgi:hypothetical protein
MEQTPFHSQSIFERVGGDFEAGLVEATRTVKRYNALKRDQDAAVAAWQAEIDDLRRQVADMEKARDRAAERYQWDLNGCLILLDAFRDDFREHLPKKLTGFETPAGTLRRDKNRDTTAKEPDDEVLPILRKLPVDAQSDAIALRPSVNWTWVKAHLIFDLEGDPILRWVDPDSGEVAEIPAVVEKDMPGDETALVPILRTVPPATPYRVSVKPVVTFEGDAGDTDTDAQPEEAADDGE